jgi:hypothetical protein
MKLVWPNQDSQKMPSMAARLPQGELRSKRGQPGLRRAADGLYLAIPVSYNPGHSLLLRIHLVLTFILASKVNGTRDSSEIG